MTDSLPCTSGSSRVTTPRSFAGKTTAPASGWLRSTTSIRINRLDLTTNRVCCCRALRRGLRFEPNRRNFPSVNLRSHCYDYCHCRTGEDRNEIEPAGSAEKIYGGRGRYGGVPKHQGITAARRD